MGKKITGIISITAVLFVGAYLIFWSQGDKAETPQNSPEPKITSSGTPVPALKKIQIPTEYASLAKSDANYASFAFVIPLDPTYITAKNVRHCVISVSAGALAEGRKPDCSDTSEENGFVLDYNKNTGILTVSNTKPEDWGINSGPFRIGCAACESAVEFSNFRTSDGQTIPTKMMSVY